MINPILTIFTAPKPFIDPHIAAIQINAIQSWKQLGAQVSIILIGNEEGVDSVAKELDVEYEPKVERNSQGTPLISSIFDIGRNNNDSPLLAYINADILIFSDFLETSKVVLDKVEKFLLVGQRWDMEITNRIDFETGWETKLKEKCRSVGKLHARGGSDYFVYPRTCFTELPKFAVGRAGWDNWMFYQARRSKWACIDTTNTIQIIHQNHDYSHLPGGQPHYRLPETNENVRLSGGRRTIFTLQDVDHEISEGVIRKSSLNWKKFWREIEIFPLISLNSIGLANLFFAIFHPQKAYLEFRNWLSSRKSKGRN